jgi:hypothetical protein
MKNDFSQYEQRLLQMKEHEEEVIIVKGNMFLVRPATAKDIERVAKGFKCMD